MKRILTLPAAVLLTVVLCVSAARAAQDEKPYYKAEFIFDTIPTHPSCHGSTIEQMPNGDILAAWYSGAFEKATDVAIFASRMPAGGGEWTKPVIIHDTPDLSDGNPVLFTAPDGKVHLFFVAIFGSSWNDCPIFDKVSTDNGYTWGKERYIREEKRWMTRNKPLVMSDGRILLPLYDEGVFQPHFYISSDNGETWSNWGLITQYMALQPTVIERKDGTLFCMMRTGAKNADIWQAESRDKGKKWSKAKMSGVPNPGSAVDMVKLANGHIALAYNNSRVERNPLTVAISEDEGRTWAYKRNLDDAPGGSYHYPAIIQDRDGIIHVTYTYNRVHIKHAAFNEAWVREGSK